ncbi:unnamed protein product [Vitrella brassicaformis CCMP3155]|uniref:Mitochondrial carrier protein n=1 Tax=Vitrella brassicaformis (strain CCMP3155) TaxID=1169540 RepID=A0A0G4F8R3_VITBC|nr:unnamed protein product [Vitrella brassicaformis CCMP3155]|eukprot:CEM08951.1 unnamed protein product [Vitrella brassicaformis CCMP3155]
MDILGNLGGRSLRKPASRREAALRGTMFGGALSGFVGRLCFHPIDTCKAKLQVQMLERSRKSGVGSGGGPPAAYRNLFSTLVHTMRAEGPAGLYRGFGVTGFGSIPATCLYFTSYEYFKGKLQESLYMVKDMPPDSKAHILTDFIAGFLAEVVSCILWVPIDVSKEQLQTQYELRATQHRGSFDAVRNIMKEGLPQLYRGYYATLLSFGPFSAFYFMFYEQFKAGAQSAYTYMSPPDFQPLRPAAMEYARDDDAGSDGRGARATNRASSPMESDPDAADVSLPFHWLLAVGAAAGSAAAFVTNPLDLVKLRLQVQRTAKRSQTGMSTPFQYRGFWQGLRGVFEVEGVRGLFRGSVARILFHAPNYALTITLMEKLKEGYLKYVEPGI